MFGCCRKQKDKGIKVTPEVKTVEESPVAKRISQKSIDVEDTAATCKESTLPEPSERGSSRFVAVFRFPTFFVRSTFLVEAGFSLPPPPFPDEVPLSVGGGEPPLSPLNIVRRGEANKAPSSVHSSSAFPNAQSRIRSLRGRVLISVLGEQSSSPSPWRWQWQGRRATTTSGLMELVVCSIM